MKSLSFLLFYATFFCRLTQAKSVSQPESNCYALDKNDYLYDFTKLAGKKFEYEGKDSDLAVRFCIDVEDRSSKGYIDYGRFQPMNYFSSANGNADFVQEYLSGDLQNCEQYGFDKVGRSAKVNIICGKCSNGFTCKDSSGCICSVSYYGNCRVLVELSLSCGPPGPRIFRGFTVGFHPRAWELVYNGITQFGYDTPQQSYGFTTEQSKVSLYFTAISSYSAYVGKPVYTVHPDGLAVKLSGSALIGTPPTTLSPTILHVDWQCTKVQESMYTVNITVPIEGYHPIDFSLGKLCSYKQKNQSDKLKGWATFGIFCCVFIVLSTAACCAGFLYRTRVQHQHGIFALPGMTVLDACLEVATGANADYDLVDDMSEAPWDRDPVANQPFQGSDSRYGTM